MPRSGTTWVARILATAPSCDYAHEPDSEMFQPLAWWAKGRLTRYPVLDAEQEARRYALLWDRAFRARIPFWRLEHATRRLSGLSGGPPRGPLASARLGAAAALGAFVLPHCGWRRADTRVVKSVFGALALPWLVARYRPRVCLVVRHPFAVVASRLALGWRAETSVFSDPAFVDRRLGELAPAALTRARHPSSDLEAFGYQVAAMTRWLKHWAANNDVVLARHEALCDAPVEGFAGLLEALGLPWRERVKAAIEAHDRPGGGYEISRRASDERDKWRRRLDARQARTLERCFADLGVDPHV